MKKKEALLTEHSNILLLVPRDFYTTLIALAVLLFS